MGFLLFILAQVIVHHYTIFEDKKYPWTILTHDHFYNLRFSNINFLLLKFFHCFYVKNWEQSRLSQDKQSFRRSVKTARVNMIVIIGWKNRLGTLL